MSHGICRSAKPSKTASSFKRPNKTNALIPLEPICTPKQQSKALNTTQIWGGLYPLGGYAVQYSQDFLRCVTAICCACLTLIIATAGCTPPVSSTEQLNAFKRAGPVRSDIDFSGAAGLKSDVGPYRVVCGDILEFQMPAVLRVISTDLPDWLKPAHGHNFIEPYLIRVSQNGKITLPIVGEMPVAGMTLAQIEAVVVDAYYPKYVINPPMVVCEVKHYQNESERVFTVAGLVNKPGAFPYPSDVRYNLMEALAFAGGMNMVADPRYLKVFRQDASGEVLTASFSVNKKSLAEAYAFVIKPGDVVYVDHTLRTRVNTFMSDVFHITFGAEARYRGY